LKEGAACECAQEYSTIRPRGPASPQPGNWPAALANLVACGTDPTANAVEWRMLGGTTSFPTPKVSPVLSSPLESIWKDTRF